MTLHERILAFGVDHDAFDVDLQRNVRLTPQRFAAILQTPHETFRSWFTEDDCEPPSCLSVLLDILEGVPEARKYLRIEEGKR
jgi:hypothetical protein